MMSAPKLLAGFIDAPEIEIPTKEQTMMVTETIDTAISFNPKLSTQTANITKQNMKVKFVSIIIAFQIETIFCFKQIQKKKKNL